MYAKQEKEISPFLASIAALQAAQSYEVWPENMPAISLFSRLSTQWRTGMSGPTGLDYNVLFYRLDRMNLSEQEHEWMFEDIQTIESEALSIIHKKD